MSVVTQLYFKIVEENNYMFRSFSGWAIIRLRLEYRRKHIYCSVDIRNGGTSLPKQCNTRSPPPILEAPLAVNEFSPIYESQPDEGPPRKGPKHVVVFFNNLKIQLCYDRHLYT
jgi:hypothetical protein